MGLLFFNDLAEKVFAVSKGRVGGDLCVEGNTVLFRFQGKSKDLPDIRVP